MDWVPKLFSLAKQGFDAPVVRQDEEEADQDLDVTQLDKNRALQQMRATLGEAHSQLLADDFLIKCLVYQKWNVQLAASIATGLLNFRLASKWPLRISADDVKPALHSGLHWLLWPRGECGTNLHQSMPDSHWTDGSMGIDGGPAACLVFNFALLDPNLCPIEQYQKLSLFLMELATDHAEVQKRGIALIVDFRGVQASRLAKAVVIDDIKRGMRCWVGSFPCRMRRIWLLGAPAVVRVLTRGVSQTLSTKLRQRIRMADGRDGLRELAADLSPCIDLPECLGGTNNSFNWKDAVESYAVPHDKASERLVDDESFEISI